MSTYPEVVLKKGEEGRLLRGHPWIYHNEILSEPEAFENGCIVTVKNFFGSYVGTGYINTMSKIRIRLIDIGEKGLKEKNVNIDTLLKEKIAMAVGKREGMQNTDARRLVFSEADSLPGLIVDQYGSTLVVQINTLGMEKLKDRIIKILDKKVKPEFIYEKSLSPSRQKEGLQSVQGPIKPEGKSPGRVTITENGLKFIVDIETGSKTGFYLDQRENREKLKNFSKDKRVLDAFCYTGGFSAYALFNGATELVGVEESEKALAIAKENMELNNLGNYSFIKADVFDMLREFDSKGEKFDLIILDPPAFSKSKYEKKGARRGYKDLHLYALKILNPRGFLLTFSCSQNIDRKDMVKSINMAAVDAGCHVDIIDALKQAADHPYIKGIPETLYLKGVVARKKTDLRSELESFKLETKNKK